ncbi:MAG: putative signal transducing protein [Candidatus Binataceae bacterium]
MAEEQQFAPDELEEVYSTMDSTQVMMAHDLLAEAGFDCWVFDAEGSRMLGSTSAILARLMVHRDRAEAARKSLKELGFGD